MMRRLNAKQIYDKLVNEDKILTLQGQIKFHLGDISIVIRQRDVVGNIMQEWMEGWMKKNEIEYTLNSNTQMPPDFYLNADDRTSDMLEIKAFYYKGSPGFDIAAFDMFEKEIRDNPFVLDTDYLIFGYDMSENGDVTVKKIWLRKVWEITRPMKTNGGVEWPVNLQIKRDIVQKIRPGKWYGKQAKYKIFESKRDFISAIEEAVYQNPATRSDSPAWKQKFIENYKKYYGEAIDIPRWNDIRTEYVI